MLYKLALPKAFAPLIGAILNDKAIDWGKLTAELGHLFDHLYQHPISEHSRQLTQYFRKFRTIPNEDTIDYLHLSRSLSVMLGTYFSLYKDIPKSAMLLNIISKGLLFFPYSLLKDRH